MNGIAMNFKFGILILLMGLIVVELFFLGQNITFLFTYVGIFVLLIVFLFFIQQK
jgi:hypothetical protein